MSVDSFYERIMDEWVNEFEQPLLECGHLGLRRREDVLKKEAYVFMVCKMRQVDESKEVECRGVNI